MTDGMRYFGGWEIPAADVELVKLIAHEIISELSKSAMPTDALPYLAAATALTAVRKYEGREELGGVRRPLS